MKNKAETEINPESSSPPAPSEEIEIKQKKAMEFLDQQIEQMGRNLKKEEKVEQPEVEMQGWGDDEEHDIDAELTFADIEKEITIN